MTPAQTNSQDEEDAVWKANHIAALVAKHQLRLGSIGDIACGTGGVLRALAANPRFKASHFAGYDRDPEAIAAAVKMLAATQSPGKQASSIAFTHGDAVQNSQDRELDAALVLDYFEHVPDYLGLLAACKRLATYKIFHIPLEICMMSVLRDACVRNRYSLGHIHYFTADSALASLRDSGHEIVDHHFTDSAGYYLQLHPSSKKKIANLPRRLLAGTSQTMAAKVFGGYSLLVLTK